MSTVDYVREVERRQLAALTRLMIGTRAAEETAEVECRAEAHVQAGAEWENRSRSTGKTARGTRTEPGQTWAETVSEQRRRRETGLPEQTAEAAAWDKLAEKFYQTRRVDALWRDGASVPGSLPGLLVAERAMTADVEDISRAVQRDARRYDGGFSIY